MEKIKIYYVDKLPGNYRGMTIPPLGIFILKKHRGNKKILEHDLVHWMQYKKIGLLDFYVKYFLQFIYFGYDKMPMEIEARKNEPIEVQTNYKNTYLTNEI